MRRPILIAALLAALGGCHAPPRLQVVGLESVQHTPDGYALDFRLEAINRNSFELPLLTISYELWLEGEQVFEGRRSGEATLRREGAQPLWLPVAVALAPGQRAPRGAVPYRLRGTVRYHTPGALSRSLFDARLVRPSEGFDLRGEIDFAAPAEPETEADPEADPGPLTGTDSTSGPGTP